MCSRDAPFDSLPAMVRGENTVASTGTLRADMADEPPQVLELAPEGAARHVDAAER